MNEIKIISELNKKFKEKHDDVDEKVDEERCFLEPCSVMGVIPKTKRLFNMCKEVFEIQPNIPDIKHIDMKTSKYSVEFLTYILTFLKNVKCESVTFRLGDDSPLVVETDEFKILLAPRVDGD